MGVKTVQVEWVKQNGTPDPEEVEGSERSAPRSWY
jgi:hypothetical protein